jgi:hypothetical protein
MKLRGWLLLIFAQAALYAQSPAASGAQQLDTSGRVAINGRSVPYLIRRLPVSSFPEVPASVQAELNRRGCLIPQTYEAHRPENVIHGAFEKPGSSDWAVLCSAQGTVSLLVFFATAPEKPFTMASSPESERLGAQDATGALGFNWGIDAASPAQIHAAQVGMKPRPAKLDHDAIADSIVDRKTVERYFTKGAWTVVETGG